MISLRHKQEIKLNTKDGKEHQRLSIGLGWGKKVVIEPVHSGGFWGFGGTWTQKESLKEIDLDASCLLYNASGDLIDQVFFGQLQSHCGSIQHSGDDQTGGGKIDAPNEYIFLQFDTLPVEVQTVIFTVSCFSGDSFEGVPNAYCNVFDRDDNTELARFDLQVRARDANGFIIAKAYQVNERWVFKAIGDPLGGRQRTLEDLLPFAENYL